jgi:carbamoyl-phosphate synthase small subunit
LEVGLSTQAVLVLADGTTFRGRGVGAEGEAIGEVVFNTAMSGYQEILTDPSYCRQIITFTYPQIGNVGVNPTDTESAQIHASGLVIHESSPVASNWRAQQTLPEYLTDQGVVGISEIDTRRLTRHLRTHGAQPGCIIHGPTPDVERAQRCARGFPGLSGADLARVVSTPGAYTWDAGLANVDGTARRTASEPRWRVVAYDFGIKRSILRLLVENGCAVEVVPAQTPAAEVLERRPDGIFLSNGPGDPEPCDYAIAATRTFLQARVPLFGICLGHQILALAAGARTTKMKFGHHGANHPVKEVATEQVYITSQNHGFAVDAETLPANLRATHFSLFDGSLQGIEHTEHSAFGFQGHPEASPGPHDIRPLFARFVKLMQRSASPIRAPHAQAN